MFFDEEDESPTRPVPKVTIVSVPGKPRRPDDDDWEVRVVKGDGGGKSDDGDQGKDEEKNEEKGEEEKDEEEQGTEEKDENDEWLRVVKGEGGGKSDDDQEKEDEKAEEKAEEIFEEELKEGKHKEEFGDCKPMSEEEELIDHKVRLRECCAMTEKCSQLHDKLEACESRVTGKEKTTEHCTEELFDFLHCVDHCVHVERKLFAHLK